MKIKEYFQMIESKVKENYAFAEKARAKSIDPVSNVEIPIALSLAERVTGLISTLYPQVADKKIVCRILELEKQYSSLDPAVALVIAEEIAKEKFCKFKSHKEAIEAGARIAIAYLTLGVVSSPIEGFVSINMGKTKEGEDYFVPFYAGPIRSAGGTEAAFSVVIIDYLREVFGYARYDPTEDEIKRGVHETYMYHERVTNLQYLPSEAEVEFLMRNVPVQISGDPSEDKEVYNYKDLPRIQTNFIRSGFCLTLNEGLALKAPKILKRIDNLKKQGFKLSGWDWLADFVKLQKKIKENKSVGGTASATYIQDIVAGRPVFGHPSYSGAFRLRYGRCRNSGYSALGVHPATMRASGNFIAIGTQLKIEKPTKGCTVAVCSTIDGPIVKFKNGDVKQIWDAEEAEKRYKEIEEIIYLGDLLVPYGDYANRNHALDKPGYVEQYWIEQLEKAGGTSELFPDFEKAVDLSHKFNIPLHPRYIYYWKEIDYPAFLSLIDWLAHGEVRGGILVLPYSKIDKERFAKGKRALEIIGCEHKITIENVVLNEKDTKSLLFNLGIDYKVIKLEEEIDLFLKKVSDRPVLELINSLCKLKIKDKSGTFIGARMGRPEKAKLRKLTGSPHVIFPVGEEGGRLRSVQAAVETGSVMANFPVYYCGICKNETIYPSCEKCNGLCRKMKYCYECDKNYTDKCLEHENLSEFKERRIDMKYFYELARKKINLRNEDISFVVKGVRGTSSLDHSCEHLSKGILRAKHNLNVNKDGTIRYDMSEMPLTHFKLKEIGTSITKLKELGYEKDVLGNEITNDEQIIEIFPHDIILPASLETLDEKADEVFLNISSFVDDELEKLYGLPRFFNAKKKEDLIGVLLGCIAPHNCAAVTGRLIGFSKTQVLLASPYIHAAMRRDCLYPTTNFVYLDEHKINCSSIGEYIEELISSGAKRKVVDSFGTEKIEINKNIYALGVDPKTMKLKKKKIKHFIRGAVPDKWVKIKTSSGREQTMTSTHKFIYLDENNKFKIKRAEEIKKGDKIAILKKFNIKNVLSGSLTKFDLLVSLIENVPEEKLNELRIVKGELFFKKLVEKFGKERILDVLGLKNINLYEWCRSVPLSDVKSLQLRGLLRLNSIPRTLKLRTIFNNKEWPFVLDITRDLASILGYYAAEGYARQNKTVAQIGFRIIEPSQRKKLVRAIKNYFNIAPNLGEHKTKITICSKLIYYLFRYCFNTGRGAYGKRVPDIAFNFSDEIVKEYLSCFFDGDGTILCQNKKNKHKRTVCFYSVSREMLDGISLLGARFGLFGRFLKTAPRLPGRTVLEMYKQLGKEPKKHILNHLNYSGEDFYRILSVLNPASLHKKALIEKGLIGREGKIVSGRKLALDNRFLKAVEKGDILVDYIKEVDCFKEATHSYCFEIDWESEEDKNVLWGEQILNARCDGDEAAVMLLMDMLLNFSKKFLPSHRGGTQDAPLVLNACLRAGEVDDMIFDVDVTKKISLSLYEAAELEKSPSEIKMERVKNRLGGENEFNDLFYSYETDDINNGPCCSSYKTLPTMQDKVDAQMELCKKIRAVDVNDVSRLIIERHFIRDIRGNLRKFSQQVFRCVACNSKYRRPPLTGKCTKCGGKLIFTISEGSILKYMQPALELARNYIVSPYLLESLELTERYIQSIFGKDKDKQEALGKWF